jgi:hypothetical protein
MFFELILLILSLIIFWSAAIYRIYTLNNVGLGLSVLLTVVSFIIIHRFQTKNKPLAKKQNNFNFTKNITSLFNWLTNNWPAFLYLPVIVFGINTLLSSRTAEAIISPWQVVPIYFFAIYAAATAIVFLSAWLNRNYTLSLIIIHLFFALSVALIVYQIGYGFDPFIHRATVKLIVQNGAVTPKPFYYLGQYGLITILHKLFFISIDWLDKLLVPVLAAFFLPLALKKIMFEFFPDRRAILLTLISFFILPLPFFIVTTPQNLAYLFLLLVIIYGLTVKNLYQLIFVYILAAATLAIHPLAGLPALLFAILLTIYHSDLKKMKKYLYFGLLIAIIFALPAAFYLVEKNHSSLSPIQTKTFSFSSFLPNWPVLPGQENFILNFIYFYGFNLGWFLFILITIGLIIAYRHQTYLSNFWLYFFMTTALLGSYFFTSLLPFEFLINYERSIYSQRILLLAIFFSFPFIWLTLYSFIYKLIKQTFFLKISFSVFIILLATTALYLTYPRQDNYYNSHIYAVSGNDIEAVRWIEADAAGEDHIVLANQQVSAAALREFGFKKYYQTKSKITKKETKIFYYPIPTSQPLYQYYLNMVYNESNRQTMKAAMDLAGVKVGYFVLNKYWWAFPKILAEAKLTADYWQKFNQGNIYVFKYKNNR